MTQGRWRPVEDPLSVVRELSAIAAPAGNEDRLTAAMRTHFVDRGLDVVVDRLGQVAVSFGPQDADRSVMVSAHLDELGLVVRGIEAEGWLRVHRLGGMPERVLPGTRLLVHTRDGDLPAVVGTKSHHLTSPEEKYVARPAADLYLDFGACSRAEALAAGVRIGDPITYTPTWDVLPNGRFAGKSLDDRVGVVALLALADRLIEQPPSARIHVAFSCQEEFNIRGTLALASRFSPDIAVAVDITPATDTPDLAGDGTVCLGGGPSLSRLSFHGRGTLGGLVPHPALVRAVEGSASAADIDIQYDAVIGVVTDAAFLPMATADGIAAVGIGIPCRYTHSPIETAQLSDVRGCADLLTELVYRITDVDLSRGASQIISGGIA
jgi:putative aminopeptidase FrvX